MRYFKKIKLLFFDSIKKVLMESFHLKNNKISEILVDTNLCLDALNAEILS